jgi:hypothetical protein
MFVCNRARDNLEFRGNLKFGSMLVRSALSAQTAFSEALEPLGASIERASFDRLVGALSRSIGIETHVTLRDVCGFSAAEARAIKVWAASALLAAAISQTPGSGARAKAKTPGKAKTHTARRGS